MANRPSLKDFLEETKNHKIHVLHDEGLYRHLSVNVGGQSLYGLDIVTYPNHLAVSGDISDGLIFSRVPDMFEFFRRKNGLRAEIDYRYWAEKLTSGPASVKEYVRSKFEGEINSEIEWFIDYEHLTSEEADDLREDVENHVMLDDYGPDANYLAALEYKYYRPGRYNMYRGIFENISPEKWYDYNYRFYLNCMAIRAAIHSYDNRDGREVAWLHPESLLQDHGITRTLQS